MRLNTESKASQAPNLPGWLKAALVVGVFTACSALGLFCSRAIFHRGATDDGPVVAAAPDMSPFFLEQRPSRVSESDATHRVVYPYSVIPGGVQSTRELTSAVMNDPVVSEHYADFDVANAQLVRLTHDETAHVSYRMNNVVYWTQRTYLLHKGELLLTDGKHQARTRCGNRVAQVLPANARKPRNEPAPETFDTPLNPSPFEAMTLPMMMPAPRPDVAMATGGSFAGGVFNPPPVIEIPGGPVTSGKKQSGPPTGAPGNSGPVGSSGPSAPSGSSGPSGPIGTSGPAGSSGPAGTPGPSGPAGTSGSPAPSGPPPTPPVTPPSAPTPPVTPTPEPGSLLMLGTGIATMLSVRKRLKR